MDDAHVSAPTGPRRPAGATATSPRRRRAVIASDRKNRARKATSGTGKSSGGPPPPRADAAEHPPQLERHRGPRQRPRSPGRRRRRTPTPPGRGRRPGPRPRTRRSRRPSPAAPTGATGRPPRRCSSSTPRTSWRSPAGVHAEADDVAAAEAASRAAPAARYRRARCTSSTTSAADRGVAAGGLVVGRRGQEARPEGHGAGPRAARGEGAGAHHGREVEEGRQLLVGPLGAVVRLHRHQPAPPCVLGDQARRAPPAPATCRRRGTAGACRWRPRRRRGRPTACPPSRAAGWSVTTVAPCAAATSAVASVEPSSTTMTSWGAGSRARSDVSRTGSVRSSSRAGTTIDTVAEPAPPSGAGDGGAGCGTRARSSTPATRPRATSATCCTAQPRRSRAARAAAATFTPGRDADPVREHVVVGLPRCGPGSPSTAPARCARTGPTAGGSSGCPWPPTGTAPGTGRSRSASAARHSGSTRRRDGSAAKRSRSCCGQVHPPAVEVLADVAQEVGELEGEAEVAGRATRPRGHAARGSAASSRR